MIKSGCNCIKCQHQLCAKRVPIFSTLSEEELMQVLALIIRRVYKKGHMIQLEGDLSSSLIIINSGMMKTFRYTPEGREQILYILSEGDFFGEMNLLSKQVSDYSIEALEDTHLCIIQKKDFQELLLKFPGISLKVMEELCARLEKMENMVQGMGLKDAEIRVSLALIEFSEKHGSDNPKGRLVNLPLSREGIANYIGVTRETVSRKLNHLQDEGVIELIGNKKLIILDEEALRQNL